MSEFEKELENKVSPHDRTRNGNELFLGGVLAEHFKDWQTPKPLLKTPQFMADWFEYQLKNNNDLDKFDGNDVFRIIQDVIKVSNNECTWGDYGIADEIAKFAEDNEELFLNLIVNCSLGYGYTVEKEKLYILKHIDLSEQYNYNFLYLSHGRNIELGHVRYSKDVDMSKIEQCHFTQSEIDKLNIGSYEQIEVKVEEVEK